MKYAKSLAMLLACSVLLCLAACGSQKDAPSVPDSPAAVSPDAAPAETPSEEPAEAPSGEPAEAPSEEPAEASTEEPAEASTEEPAKAPSGGSEEVKNEGLAEYQFALQQIAFEHVYPDGRDTGFDGAYGFIEDNQFALCDVNGDGADELIVRFTTAPMAGNTETVYTYQEADGTLKELLTASPGLIYYEGGIVKEDWSHGSWLAGEDYWPYTLYRYDAAEGSYEELAQVNMWSKAVDVVDNKGDPYPDDIDAEGAGTVFILSEGDEVRTVSKSDYERWLADTVGDSAELDIPYQALSEENIKALIQY